MLSKEEIEEAKKEGYEIIGNFKSATTELTKDIFPKKAKAVEILLEYIEQLETREQKLIEKLENENQQLEHDILTMSIDTGSNFSLKQIGRAEGMKKQNDTILSIWKGENNE